MANKGDIYKVALPNGDEYNFKDKYVRENYRALNNNDFDTINVTELNSGNLINTGAARFLNTINGSVSGTSSNVTGTVAIANGGTGATTRLSAAQNLTNEAVTSPTHIVGLTTNWGKFGYTTIAQLKSTMSLNNVENKSSATIRGELTSANVTTALGYTPVNKAGDTMTGQLTIQGSAASKPLKVRGICGYDGSSAEDALYLNYGNTTADTVFFGNTGGGAISSNGTQYSGNAATATTATKLGTSTVGGTTTPIYLNAGVPTALSYTIAKSVPSNAVFTDTTYSAGDNMTLSSTTFYATKRWNAITQGQKWSRIMYVEPTYSTEGTNGILAVSCTRANVVCNATFIVSTSHASVGKVSLVGSTNYSNFNIRVVVNSGGAFYFEIDDTANNIASGTAQTWHCSYLPLMSTTVTVYTAFTDGTTIPSGFTACNQVTTVTGDGVYGIRDITRSGTTFTATRQNGTTFTFTQQDNNTTYGIGNSGESITLTAGGTGTSVSLSTLINGLATGSSTPVDADYYVSQYVNGGTTTTSYHRRPMSALWAYIKGKADSTYLASTTKYAGSSSVGGAANSANQLNDNTSYINSGTSYVTHTDVSVAKTYLSRYNNMGINSSNSAGCFVLASNWSSTAYNCELSLGMGDSLGIYYRGKNNGTYTSWQAVGRFSATPTSGQVVITDGTTGGIKSSGYTIAKSVPSNAVFTDQNVNQSATTTSNWRKIVLSYQDAASEGTAVTANTNVVYVTPNAEIQPSTGTIRSAGNMIATVFGVNASNGTSGGISLYSGAGNVDNYGIAFRKTANKEKHGYVQSDWATYFTMNSGATTRGWIYRLNQTDGNVASISGAGNAVFNGSVTIGGNSTNTSGVRQVYNATTQSLDFVFVA